MKPDPDQLGILLHDGARLIRRRFEQQAASYGLSSAQWRLLVQVLRTGGITQARLADRLEIEPISVSRLVDRMEQAGWVMRQPDPADRRIKVIVATETTHKLKAEVKAIAHAVFAEALSGLTPEARDTLLTGLATLNETLSKTLNDDAATCKDQQDD